MTQYTDEIQRVREAFIRVRGYWHPSLDPLLKLNPAFFEAYARSSAIPWQRRVLSPKEKEFVYIAIDANATHLYEPGLRLHIRNALKQGATAEEVGQVFQLVGMVGIHTFAVALPILLDEAGITLGADDPKLVRRHATVKEECVRKLGYWSDEMEALSWLDAEYVLAIAATGMAAEAAGPLTAKTKAFVGLAADATTTRMFAPGIRRHIREALNHGASVCEILEVLQLVSSVGLHSCTFGAPILFEELEQQGESCLAP